MKKVGLIGLGLMGAPMARNWLKKNFNLTVLPHKNLTVVGELKSLGAKTAINLSELVAQSDVIVLMVPTSVEVEELTIGKSGLIHLLQSHHTVVDMSTSSPESTKKIFQEFDRRSLKFFDSPVTGGVKGANEGTLTLFVGGPKVWFEEVKEVLEAVSKIQSHFGDIGNGHIAKIINNLICIGNLAVFAEALPLAIRFGLKPKELFDTLLSGTASSEMLKIYGPQILADDFTARFKLEHAHKDMKLAQELSSSVSVVLPVLEGVLKNFEKPESKSLGLENISALIKPMENELGAFFRG
ncbi:MAG: NAD(P)-dependent oxidoreductase [Oligoflexia bacterium]|nr:NAD(P)-dependent oxidoreductase [Oligoflexia bacterium]